MRPPLSEPHCVIGYSEDRLVLESLVTSKDSWFFTADFPKVHSQIQVVFFENNELSLYGRGEAILILPTLSH